MCGVQLKEFPFFDATVPYLSTQSLQRWGEADWCEGEMVAVVC